MTLLVRRILYPTDFSDTAEQALGTALGLARAHGATLHHYHAIVTRQHEPDDPDTPPGSLARYHEHLDLVAQDRTRAALQHPDARGLTVRTITEQVPAAAPAILAYANERDVDLIVMGTHGRRGVRRWLIGSVAEEVVRRARCPVLTVRSREHARPVRAWWRILVPVDLSESSLQALAYAKALARTNDATVQALHVVEPVLLPAYYQIHETATLSARARLLDRAQQELQAFLDRADMDDLSTEAVVVFGHAKAAIVEHAQEADSDLIVISTHGRTGLDHFLLGSVTAKVVRRAHCPVLTVKTFGKSLLDTAAAPTGKTTAPGAGAAATRAPG